MGLKEKAKGLPETPGVYLMKDAMGYIIYVGKAKKLKNRVQSYFQQSQHHSKKVKKLIKNVSQFEVIYTDTEFEAFLLENELIKKYRPFFNSRLKSPQGYPYLVIVQKEGRREIILTNEPKHVKENPSHIFGPFTSKNAVQTVIDGIKAAYKINCTGASTSHSACLNYYMGSCIGICLGGAPLETYEQTIDRFILLLQGKDNQMLDDLKRLMTNAAEQFDFSNAAKLRDTIKALSSLVTRNKGINFIERAKNIVMIEPLADTTIKLFLIKGNQIVFRDKLAVDNKNIKQIQAIILTNIFKYFPIKNRKLDHKLNQEEVDEASIIYSYLKKKKNAYIAIPQTLRNRGNQEIVANKIQQLFQKLELVSSVDIHKN